MRDVASTGDKASSTPRWARKFAVRGVFWREYLDWAVINAPFYLHFVLLCYWTLFFFFFAAPARRALLSNFSVLLRRSSRLVNYLRVLKNFYNFAWVITDAATYRLRRVHLTYEFEGSEFLDQLAAAHGAIVLTAHMGNYDLGAALFAHTFQRTLRMVRAPEPDSQTQLHLRRSIGNSGMGGVQVDYNTAGAFLSFDLLSALREGEIVSIQGDRPIAGVAQTEAEMCGRKFQVPTGPFILSLTANVPIYPLFIARKGHRRYRIITAKPIVLTRTEHRQDDVARGVATWTAVLEKVATAHWDQWFAFTPLFR